LQVPVEKKTNTDGSGRGPVLLKSTIGEKLGGLKPARKHLRKKKTTRLRGFRNGEERWEVLGVRCGRRVIGGARKKKFLPLFERKEAVSNSPCRRGEKR